MKGLRGIEVARSRGGYDRETARPRNRETSS